MAERKTEALIEVEGDSHGVRWTIQRGGRDGGIPSVLSVELGHAEPVFPAQYYPGRFIPLTLLVGVKD